MGNAVGRSKKAKVMKIDGETFKLKMPARANDVVKDYPGHVLLDSEAVKYFGPRAKPLEPHQELKPNKIYFLVELPKMNVQPEEDKALSLPRRVRSSGISSMKAKDRLELLMLSKRSVSDVSVVKSSSNLGADGHGHGPEPMRVKLRLPKAQLDRLMEESHDGAEVAEKITSLYIENNDGDVGGGGGGTAMLGGKKEVHNHRPRGKRVTFSPVELGEIGVQATPQ